MIYEYMAPKKISEKPTLFVYNLGLDNSSYELAATIDWINAFASQCNKVYVFSTHIGQYNLPPNVRAIELGGGSFLGRCKWIINTTRSVILYLKLKKNVIIFHHMSQYTAIYPGILFRLFQTNQGLWYAHNHKNLSLFIAEKVVNFGFTSVKGAFPINSRKVHIIGQGINVNKFLISEKILERKQNAIVSLGRISPVKNLEKLLSADIKNFEIQFIGRVIDHRYKIELQLLAKKQGKTLKILNPIPYRSVPKYLANWKYYYCGTQVAVDKASIEAALSGCLILSTNSNVIQLTGMSHLYNYLRIGVPATIESQIQVFESLDKSTLRIVQSMLKNYCAESNNVENTTMRIISILDNYKSVV